MRAVPFTFVLVAVTWAWFKALREEDGSEILQVDIVDRPRDAPVAVGEERAP